MCDCKSNNLGIGTVEPYQMDYLAFVDPDGKEVHKTADVDACISEVIQRLNYEGYPTIASCCGHNRHKPSIVFSDVMSDDDFRSAAAFLKNIDDRDFELSLWRRVNPVLCYQSKYPLWGRVILEDDISAVITAVKFSASTMYCVEWFSKGSRQSEWMLEREMDEFTRGDK